MFTFKPRSAATLTARCGTQLLIKRHFSRASTSPCIACSKMFSSVNQMLKARSIHSITEALIKQQQHFLKAGGRQGSLTGGRGEGHDWLAQNTRGNPRKAREGERITNTGQDGLTTVSLSKAKNSRRKRGSRGEQSFLSYSLKAAKIGEILPGWDFTRSFRCAKSDHQAV